MSKATAVRYTDPLGPPAPIRQRPVLPWLIFGVGDTSLNCLEGMPRRPPTEEEVRLFVQGWGSGFSAEPLWVMEYEATRETVDQLYDGDRAILCCCRREG